MAAEADEEALTLDCLPFDCIVCVCEFLPPEDLARFSAVCKLFHEASQTGLLWRQHCLQRWTFCDVLQVPEGPQRWRRYFMARRVVESRLDRGRPGRDYRVKTLRGHDKEISSAVVMEGGGSVNWEYPKPPLVVSLSTDGCVKAWDILQAKPVWSVDGEGYSCMAANEKGHEIAMGKPDGSITVWDVQEWRVKFELKSGAGAISALKYGAVKSSKLPNPFLLAYVTAEVGGTDQLEVWDVGRTDIRTPLLELWAPYHSGKIQLSSSGLLSLEAGGGDVHVWDLPALTTPTDPPPLPPHVTLHTPEWVTGSCWVSPGSLATHCRMSVSIDVWDVAGHIEAGRKVGRSLYDHHNMYNATRSIPCHVPTTSMCAVNGLLIAGDQDGGLSVLNPTTGEVVQGFSDHKASVTGLYADNFRILSCSKDFSIRIYRWIKPKKKGSKPQLESRYTLLGGSVALKTHDGFNHILCEAGSCIGVAGNQLKFYTFSCKLD